MDSTPTATCNVSYLLSLKWNLASNHIANYYVLRLCEMRRHSRERVVFERGTSSTVRTVIVQRTGGLCLRPDINRAAEYPQNRKHLYSPLSTTLILSIRMRLDTAGDYTNSAERYS
jgi:hypothetical protein